MKMKLICLILTLLFQSFMISAESEIERLEKLVNDLLENNEYLNSEMSDLKSTIQVSCPICKS